MIKRTESHRMSRTIDVDKGLLCPKCESVIKKVPIEYIYNHFKVVCKECGFLYSEWENRGDKKSLIKDLKALKLGMDIEGMAINKVIKNR